MLRHVLLCFPLALCFSCLTGCGNASGPAKMSEQPAYSDAEAAADADYEAMQNKNQSEGYGS